MINLESEFSPRANPADANYPFGSIKDNTSPGANDGTPLAPVMLYAPRVHARRPYLMETIVRA